MFFLVPSVFTIATFLLLLVVLFFHCCFQWFVLVSTLDPHLLWLNFPLHWWGKGMGGSRQGQRGRGSVVLGFCGSTEWGSTIPKTWQQFSWQEYKILAFSWWTYLIIPSILQTVQKKYINRYLLIYHYEWKKDHLWGLDANKALSLGTASPDLGEKNINLPFESYAEMKFFFVAEEVRTSRISSLWGVWRALLTLLLTGEIVHMHMYRLTWGVL